MLKTQICQVASRKADRIGLVCCERVSIPWSDGRYKRLPHHYLVKKVVKVCCDPPTRMSDPEVCAQTASVPKSANASDEPRDFPDSDLDFLADYTGCSDYPKLRARVIEFWREVKATVYVYGCIQNLMFLIPRIQMHPVSAAVVHNYKATILKDPGKAYPFLLEVGSCFGTDLRWLVKQGVKARSLIATDLTPDYWELGYKLFEDKDVLDVHSFFGSMADSAFISAHDAPLGPFCGKVHYVWAGAVLHCLSEEDVATLLENVFRLLRPGGTFFGDCGGSEPGGPWPTSDGQPARYLHSQASLKETLERVGFSDVSVVHVELPQPQDARAVGRVRELGREPAMLSFAAKKV